MLNYVLLSMKNFNNEKKMLIIHGCGGHARSLADVALYNDYKKLVFYR